MPPQGPRRAARSQRATERCLLVGNYLPSLAAVRSLAAAGYHSIAGDGGEFSTVAYSRHCDEVWRHPPVSHEEAFLTALTAFLEARPEVSVVLPLQEHYVALLAKARDRLPVPPVVASPAPEVVLTCLDKERTYEIAREVGVPYQRVAVAQDLDELRATCHEVGFPCIVRPPRGASAPMPEGHKALICHDQAALERVLPVWPDGHASLLVQRYAPGPRHNVAFAAREGRILARVETEALRVGTPDGTGLRVEGSSVAPDSRLVEYCDALVGRLGYTGVGLAQFILPQAGEPHFLELNPRHGVALAFVQNLGLDLTRAAIELAKPGGAWEPEPGFRYPVGVRYAWTTGDLHALRLARGRGQVGAGESVRWLGRAIRAAVRADIHATWELRDPLPTIAILAQWLPFGPWKRVPLRDRRDERRAGRGVADAGRRDSGPGGA